MPSTDDPVARARALARLLHELASLVERYEHVDAHARAEPGRTPERRDAMRTIAARFPGALRELDTLGEAGARARGDEARRLLAALVSHIDIAPALAELRAPEHAWIRYAVELQPRLREVLRIKRWLAERAGTGPIDEQTRARLRSWYADEAGGGDPGARMQPDDDLIDRVAVPPGGQIQQAAYADAARALGISVDELKRTLYPDGED